MKSKRKTGFKPGKVIFISFATLTALSIIAIYIILYSYDLNSLKPYLSGLVRDATGRELVIGGNIHLQVSLAPRVIVEDIGLRNAEWGSRQNMIQAKRLKLQVALLPLLSNHIIVKQLVISQPDILLETSRDGKTNFEFERQSEPKDEPLEEKAAEKNDWPVFGSKKIIIENGRFTFNNLESEETYTAKLKRLTFSGKDIEAPVNLKLLGVYNNQTVRAEGTVGPLPALSDPSEKFVLELLIKTGGNSLLLDGSIKDITSIQGLVIDLEAKIKNPISIEKLTGQTFPIKEPFKLSGALNAYEPDTYVIPKLSFTSQDAAFKGSFEIRVKGNRPKIKAVIDAEALNLASLFSDSSAVKPAPVSAVSKKKGSKVFPEVPLPNIPFNSVDADIQLKVKSLILPETAFQNLAANIDLKNGHLHIDDFKTDMGTGRLDGSFHVSAAKKNLHVETTMKVEQLPLNLLIPTKKVTDSLEGDIDMFFSLNGQGKSVAEIMSNLNGDFGLSMCNGEIATKYIDLLGVDFSTGLVKMINPFKKRTNYTEVNCFVCILDINDGIVKTKALVLDTGRTMTVGNGRVDLKTEKLDISLKSVPKEGIGFDKIGKISISFSEFYKPFKISGTLAEPKLVLDITKTAITLSKIAGGVALLGPAGAALALITGRIGDDNPCLSAVEAVRQGSKEEGLRYDKKSGIIKKTTDSIADRLKKLFEKNKTNTPDKI